MMIKRERSCCTRRKSSIATSTQASRSARGSGTRTDAHPLPQLVCTLGSDAHRRQARQDEEERERHIKTGSIDQAFIIDNGDLCTGGDGASWIG